MAGELLIENQRLGWNFIVQMTKVFSENIIVYFALRKIENDSSWKSLVIYLKVYVTYFIYLRKYNLLLDSLRLTSLDDMAY